MKEEKKKTKISSIKGGSLVLMCCHPEPTALTASESDEYIAALRRSSSARRRDDERTRENTCSNKEISSQVIPLRFILAYLDHSQEDTRAPAQRSICHQLVVRRAIPKMEPRQFPSHPFF